MTAALTLTWDFALPGLPARAASIADLGDAALVDDAIDPPIPPEMPYAAQLNQWALQLGGMNRIIPALDLQIHFTAGTPAIFNVAAMSSIITTTWAQAHLTVTHSSTGVVMITWTAGTLPPPRAVPRAWVLSTTALPQPQALALSNGVQVSSWNLAGAATDLDFVVSVL
jgi:hypothetical protein